MCHMVMRGKGCVHRVEVVEEGSEGDGHVGVGEDHPLGCALAGGRLGEFIAERAHRAAAGVHDDGRC